MSIETTAWLAASRSIQNQLMIVLLLVALAALLLVLGLELQIVWLMTMAKLAGGIAGGLMAKTAWDELRLVQRAGRYVQGRLVDRDEKTIRSVKRALRHARFSAMTAWPMVVITFGVPLVGHVSMRVPALGLTFVLIIAFLCIEVLFLPGTYRALAHTMLESQFKPRIRTLPI